MRKSFLNLGMGALLAGAASASMAAAIEYMQLRTTRHRINFDRVGRRTVKIGKRHKQHCGARQQARYRRQIEAGQLTFNGIKLGRSAAHGGA